MKPIQTNIICPSGRRVTVTSFDVDALIFDMLNDKHLFQIQNMIFEGDNEENPFELEISDSYSDFHTSEFYIQTYKEKK